MAWAPSFSCTATFGRSAPILMGPWLTTSSTTKHLRPSRTPPTTWTSWTTTAGADRALRTALVSSTTRRTTPSAGKKKPGPSSVPQGQTDTEEKELEFDVILTADDADHFRENFVLKMREKLTDGILDLTGRVPPDAEVRQTHIPTLREEVTVVKPDLMNLTLLAGEARVTLRVRTDNLYVVGFRNGQGRWFEFRHENRAEGYRMIPGSNILGFTGSYLANGIGDFEHHGNDPIFDRWAVVRAIRGLHSYNGGTYDDLKLWLRTLIINFMESVRFEPIAERAASQMSSYPPQDSAARRLTGREINFIRNWGHLSEEALRLTGNNQAPATSAHGATSTKTEDSFSSLSRLGIHLLQVLGMVHTGVKIKIEGTNKRPRRAVEDDDIGLTLAEVVGVVIRNINNYDPGKLYGTITLTDGLGAFKLYNRGKDHYQEVGPGGKADLAYPPRPIFGADDFVIDVDLMDHYTFFGSDHKVALGQVYWNSRDTLSGDYNTILKVPVKAQHGEVEVQYAVLTDAAVAKVEVVLVDSGIRVFSPDVYGSVTVTTTMASGEPLQYSLFDKPRERYVTVPEKATIPLQRKLVSAPMGIGLEVSASLWDANALEPDDHFINGSVTFTPRQVRTDSQKIMGSRGMIRVQVTWSTTYEW